MNKLILAFVLSLCIGTLHAQETKTAVDEFTGAEIKKTEWQYVRQSFSSSLAIRFRKINNNLIMDAAITMGANSYFSVMKEDALMLKTDSGKVIKLYPKSSAISTRGGAYIDRFAGSEAVGVTLLFELKEDDVEALKTENVVKYRLYTNKGYVEEDLREKKAQILRSMLLAVE